LATPSVITRIALGTPDLPFWISSSRANSIASPIFVCPPCCAVVVRIFSISLWSPDNCNLFAALLAKVITDTRTAVSEITNWFTKSLAKFISTV